MQPAELAALQAALGAVQAAVALYDARDDLRWCNASYEERFLRGRALPINFADVIRHGFRGGFGVRIDSGDVERFLEGVLMRRRSVPHRAFPTDLTDGTWLWITETLVAGGWLMSIGVDVTALKQEERVLRQARDLAMVESLTDALTGLPNRRHMMDELLSSLATSAATGQPLAIALLDLDHFKSINDRFGHDGGDEVLRAFALHAAGLGPGCKIGRMGGEEFLVLMPGLYGDPARRLIDMLRQRIPVAHLPDQLPVSFTFSAGVAEHQGMETPAALMRRADVALYRAKAAGRDRVELAGTGPQPPRAAQ